MIQFSLAVCSMGSLYEEDVAEEDVIHNHCIFLHMFRHNDDSSCNEERYALHILIYVF